MFDVNDVVADGEVAEVGDEGGGFGFAAADGAGGDVGVVGEILRAEDDELACCRFVKVEYLDAGGDGGFDDDRSAEVDCVSAEVAGFGVDGGAAGGFAAGAEAVGDVVLLQEAGEAFDFALGWCGEEDAGFLLHQGVERVDERGDGAVEAHGGARGKVDFGEVAAVGVKDVDGAELVEFEARELVEAVVEIPGREVDVFGADEVADAGAVVTLLDLVPPALALIFDHGGLFDEDAGCCRAGGAEEIEEGEVGSGDGGEELPAGEDGGFSGTCADVSEKLGGFFSAFEGCTCGAGAGEAGVDGS